MPTKNQDLAEAFLATAHEFKLGDLPTEQRHPDTVDLADLSRNDPATALSILRKVDVAALEKVLAKESEIARMSQAIGETLKSGGRIFFYGCGATGRLALSIDYIWRFVHRGMPEANRTMGFMSGGDLALVHSIESFEDHPEYGARQVREIGFKENDLLISCTEGGETPSVIGATEEAARISRRKPWFLYCNPDDLLRKVERSRQVIENPGIEKISLFVGPMSLSGSTRLQATTVLQLAAGSALIAHASAPGFPPLDLRGFFSFMKQADYGLLLPFVEAESAAYAKGEYFLYETNYYAITLLTDTTERSPTFSLPGFENQREPNSPASLSYVSIPQSLDTGDAWSKLLLREPVALEWEELNGVAGERRMFGFDFSSYLPTLREKKLNGARQHIFRVERRGGQMELALGNVAASVDVSSLHPLVEHLFLKMLMNAHSTLVMGRIGRFESNVMTWVKPSNNKLIDRSIRYVEFLLKKEGIEQYSYREIALELFDQIGSLAAGESVVLKTSASLRKKAAHRPASSAPSPRGPIKAADIGC
jgi:N-acetylmuramic acid 6-phosphate etherase